MAANGFKTVRKRLIFLMVLFSLALAALVGRAVEFQIMDRERYAKMARAEGVRTLKPQALRGDIYDRNGEKLALSLMVQSVFANGREIRDAAETSAQLARILNLDAEALREKLDEGKSFMWIKRQIEPGEEAAVRALELPGVYLTREYRRFYPNQNLAAHLLGFVGVDGQGLEGLELGLNNYLAPREEPIVVRRDAMGRILMDSDNLRPEQRRGASVFLTIDRRLQYLAEKHLQAAVEASKAKSGQILMVRPKTGEILASAVWPQFNPNEYQAYKTASRRNRMLTDAFEPGSTFKVFVVAAALEERLVGPQDLIACESGAYRVVNHVIRDTGRYDQLTVSEVIKKSSNIGAVKIGAMLGHKRMYSYLSRFSFGERTDLQFVHGESAGRLRSPLNRPWHELDAANMTFGQGLSVTSLQMVMAMSALANDGLLMRPYVVERVVDANGQALVKNEPRIMRQVVAPTTARQVGAMLRMAVLPGGTGRKADCDGYPVAGKTGTAQKVSGGRTYAAGRYVASFLGYVPYNDPQLCLMVVLDEPGLGSYYGGEAAAPVFRAVAAEALPLLNVSPDFENLEPRWPTNQIQRAASKPAREVKAPRGPNVVEGKIALKKLPRSGALPAPPAQSEGRVFGEDELMAEPQSLEVIPGIMPDLAGLSMAKVLDILGPQPVEVKYEGSGLVVEQDPPPGSMLSPGQLCQVRFEGF